VIFLHIFHGIGFIFSGQDFSCTKGVLTVKFWEMATCFSASGVLAARAKG
jgi:hypothetical protein